MSNPYSGNLINERCWYKAIFNKGNQPRASFSVFVLLYFILIEYTWMTLTFFFCSLLNNLQKIREKKNLFWKEISTRETFFWQLFRGNLVYRSIANANVKTHFSFPMHLVLLNTSSFYHLISATIDQFVILTKVTLRAYTFLELNLTRDGEPRLVWKSKADHSCLVYAVWICINGCSIKGCNEQRDEQLRLRCLSPCCCILCYNSFRSIFWQASLAHHSLSLSLSLFLCVWTKNWSLILHGAIFLSGK